MHRSRQALVIALVAALAPSAAVAQDWDVGPARPTRPTRPAGPSPARPVRPATPARPTQQPTRPPEAAQPGGDVERNRRMIEHLTSVLLGGSDDNAVALPTLLRLVRERDGSLDTLTADLERRALGAGPDAAGANLLLGHILRQNARFDEATTRYRRASELAPQNPAPVLALAEVARQTSRTDDARAAYERALRMNVAADRQGEILRALIDLALSAGDAAGARTWHRALVARSPASASVRRELADALMARRMFADAITEYQSLARALSGDNRVLPPVLRDLGRAQMQAGQLDEALATFRRALAFAGADAGVRRELYDDMTELRTRRHELDAWIRELEAQGGGTYERAMLLGRLHGEGGEVDASLAAYRRAVALRPADVDARVQLIQLLTQSARLDELLAARRALVAVAPRNPAFAVELADELVRRGRRDEALRVLAQASARAGADADVHERLAQVYARMSEGRLALRETELVARFDPSDPAALEALGERLMELGQRDRALATWQRIRDAARDRARGAAALADVYGRHDMAPQAIELYREALSLRPDELEYHKGLAVLLEASRQYEPAIAAWRRVIALSGDNRELRREARTRVVNLWNLQGVLPARVPELERAFAATPPDLEAGRDLAEAYTRLRRLDDAARVLGRLVGGDPHDVTTLAVLERLLAQRGDLAGALGVARRLVVEDPRHARDWHLRVATHALALHRDAEAVESVASAVQMNPDDANGHLRLGELYRTRNDAAQAAASFRRAIALNDRLFPTYFLLADLELSRDDPRGAVDLYRRVIRLAPDDDLVARAGRMAIQIAPAADALPDLERDLSTASAAAPTRVVLRRLLVDLYAAVCRPLLNAVRHGSPEASARARAELTRLGARALKPLLDTLGDADAARQRVALEVLGYLGNPNATTALLTVAEAEGPHEVRLGALRAAASLADARALPRLAALADGHDLALATTAAWGIGRVRTPAATALLVRLVARAAEPDVSAMAALGLTGSRAPAARAALLAALGSERGVRLSAAAMLALAPAADAAVVQRLRAGLLGAEWLRASATAALGATPGVARDAVVRDLAAGLFSPMVLRWSGGDLPLGRVAARALTRLARRDDGATARALSDPDAASSVDAMLGRLFDPPGGLADDAALVRFAQPIGEAARDALATPQGIDQVLDALSTPGRFAPLSGRSGPVSAEAAEAERAVRRAVAPALAALAGHPDAPVRRRVLRVLAGCDAPEAAAALARGVSDEDESVSEAALSLLASREGAASRGAPASLVEHLGPENPWKVRLTAAGALARSDAPGAVDALVRALASDPFSIVREAAARSLARSAADPGARSALERASRDDVDAAVRAAAARALGG